jgi:8-oxo-dGTP diphosphatase
MIEHVVGNIRVFLGTEEVIDSFDAVVVVLFSSKGLVLVRDERRAWEFPGGHREGDETYEETAAREVFEEAGVRITDIKYLGYYTTGRGHTTVIVCGEVTALERCDKGSDSSAVGTFASIPADLSFGDGREKLFFEYAIAFRTDHQTHTGLMGG